MEFDELLIKPFFLHQMGKYPLIVLIGSPPKSQKAFLKMYIDEMNLPLDFYTPNYTSLQNISLPSELDILLDDDVITYKETDLNHHYYRQTMEKASVFVTSYCNIHEKSTGFRKFVFNHYILKINLIILLNVNNWCAMPLWVNPNINFIFLGLEEDLNITTLKNIYNQYFGLFGCFGKFVDTYRYLAQISQGRGYLVIDRTTFSNRFEDVVKYLE